MTTKIKPIKYNNYDEIPHQILNSFEKIFILGKNYDKNRNLFKKKVKKLFFQLINDDFKDERKRKIIFSTFLSRLKCFSSNDKIISDILNNIKIVKFLIQNNYEKDSIIYTWLIKHINLIFLKIKLNENISNDEILKEEIISLKEIITSNNFNIEHFNNDINYLDTDDSIENTNDSEYIINNTIEQDTNKQETNKQETNKQETNKQKTNKQETNKQDTNEKTNEQDTNKQETNEETKEQETKEQETKEQETKEQETKEQETKEQEMNEETKEQEMNEETNDQEIDNNIFIRETTNFLTEYNTFLTEYNILTTKMINFIENNYKDSIKVILIIKENINLEDIKKKFYNFFLEIISKSYLE